jgi:predicted transcriptional regulator
MALSAKNPPKQFNVRIPHTLEKQVERLSKLSGRSRAYIATEALAAYLEWRIPQQEDLRRAKQEARRAKLIPHEHVVAKIDAMIKKYEN